MPRFQYSLRSLFWVMTLVAILGAAGRCAMWYWGDRWGHRTAVLLLLTWPTLATIIFTCPDVSGTTRLRLYQGTGLVVFLANWLGEIAFTRSLLDATMSILLALTVILFIVWVPQFLFVFGVATYLRERRRKNEASAATEPSGPSL